VTALRGFHAKLIQARCDLESDACPSKVISSIGIPEVCRPSCGATNHERNLDEVEGRIVTGVFRCALLGGSDQSGWPARCLGSENLPALI